MQIKYRPGELLGTLYKYKQSHVSGMPPYLHLNQTIYIYSTQNICGVAKTLGNSNAAISAFFPIRIFKRDSVSRCEYRSDIL
ncbi:hypothetical protein BDZ91DRAFT_726787, partial [Kalaharituber pfeilii]